MPFASADATKHTKKATTAKLRKQWSAVANSVLQKCIDDGKTTAECDASAIKQANSALIKETGDVEEEITQAAEVSQEDAEPVEAAELYIDTPEPISYSSAVTFDDLDAERQVESSLQDVRNDTADLTRMVNDIWWREEITDKVGALRPLFAEYLVRITEHLGESSEPPAEEAPGDEMEEGAAIDLLEQSAMLSLTEASIDDLAQFDALLSEQRVELANPRRAPVMVDFAIIQPGHGNKKDKRYYPADMLERDGGAFEGVDIFVTNHDEDEKNERNKVGRFRSIAGLAEQGLIGTAILYDPDMAEKARNRADAGELGTLHCSIYASGTGKQSTVDGQDVTVIESITKVHSVDLVSKAGAGGHAISLTESDGGTPMDEKEKKDELQPEEEAPQEEAPLAEVEIRESDEETPVAEEEAPLPLAEDAVSALLAESGLDENARIWLTGRTYQDEAAVRAAIAEMQVFISELVPTAGQPFALGESAPVGQDVPKLLTAQEQLEQMQANTRLVLAEIEPTYKL